MKIENQVDLLNDLVTKAYDAEHGYKEAAEKVNDPEIKSIFHEYSKQRYDFGHAIKDEIKKLGGVVVKGDSTASSIHRAWIDLKAAVASNEEKAVLNEVVRGEEYALSTYNEALEELPVGTSAYGTIVNQRNAIRTAIDRMKNLAVISEVK